MRLIDRSTLHKGPVGLAALAVTLFLGVGLWYTRGHLTPPLDDTAIHLQYAEQIAHGQYYRYQDGDPRTSGATSWLYIHLLSVFAFLGFHGSRLIWVSLLLGAFLFCLLVALASRFQTNNNRLGFLLALHGGLLWSFLSGMEIALTGTVLVALLVSYKHESCSDSPSDFRATILFLILLALLRPEGGFVAVVVAVAVGARMRDAGKSWRRIGLGVRLPVAAAVLWPYVWTRLSTGRWSSNGLLAKSLFDEPTMTWGQKGAALIENLRGVFWWLWGTPEYVGRLAEYLPPAGILLAAIGVGSLVFRARNERGWRRLLGVGPLAFLSVLVVAASVSTLSVWSLHNYRYLLPIVPVLLVLLVIGLEEVARWGAIGGAMSRTLFVLILVAQIAALPLWLSRYGRNCGSIYAKQRGMAEWIAKNIDPASRVAVNDAGILALFSKRHTVDLVGLMNNETTIPYRTGEGSLYEYLSDLPEKDRFSYYAVFPEWFELFLTFDVFGEAVVRFPDPFDPTFEKVLYRAAWRPRGLSSSPRPSAATRPDWRIVDQIDVADIQSEAAHEYTCEESGQFPPNPVPFRRNFGYHEEIESLFPHEKDADLIPRLAREDRLAQFDVLDAGRRHGGGERFVVSGLQPGRDLAIVLRTCQDKQEHARFEYQMAVFVDGAFAGTWTIHGTPWNWYERWLIVPGSFVTGSRMTIRVTAIPTATDPYYASYYYWFLQPS